MEKKYILILIAGLLNACGTTRLINIESSPQGAEIIADGKHIGVTPLQIDAEEIFPPRWTGGSYMVKGNLELEKPGCDRVVMQVDDMVLSKDIKHNLDCNGVAKKAMDSTVEEPALKPDRQKLRDIEARLMEVEELFTRGLINKEEYDEQRRRILNDI